MRIQKISRGALRWAAGFGGALLVLALGGCGSGGAGRMTSYSTTTAAANQPELFSLPANQMSHIQVVSVTRAPFQRTLRLSGAVEYNAFKTTPVISQVGGPVSRILVVPGSV